MDKETNQQYPSMIHSLPQPIFYSLIHSPGQVVRGREHAACAKGSLSKLLPSLPLVTRTVLLKDTLCALT